MYLTSKQSVKKKNVLLCFEHFDFIATFQIWTEKRLMDEKTQISCPWIKIQNRHLLVAGL